MNEISTEQLLSQIRALNNELQGSIAGIAEPVAEAGFGELLKSSLSRVNETQQEAATLKESYLAEDPDTSIGEVMIAAQKADLSFRAMTEVRNKLITAYQDIMNMPV